MNNLKMQTNSISNSNFHKLAELFPNAITESTDENGQIIHVIDADILEQEINTHVVKGREERYQFTWPGKRQAMLAANAPITSTLRPYTDESVGRDGTQGKFDSENLYIEGDNLEALRLLQETYLGKIKVIYIDPPYNTGSDFVYKDSFEQGTSSYLSESGQYGRDGVRLVQNFETNGRFHTDWLNMMYPRLKIAKNLLSDDGIIFISIDDNENHNLRKICDEIFGASNYLNQFAWISNITGRQISGRGAAKTWETILVYCKKIEFADSLFINIQFAKSQMPDAYKGFNRDIRTDKYGDFAIGDTLYNHNRKFNEETRPNLVFSIFYNPETEQIITGEIGEKKPGFIELPPHPNGDGTHKYHAWRWSKQKIANESHDLIVLETSRNGYEIYTRIRDFNRTLLKDVVTNISNGDAEVQKLLDGKKCFDYPKSVDLLKTLVGAVNSPDVILDFFSGSATTAHAVMQLNAEDGGNRKFIMVQLDEKTPEKSEARKAGYSNICEIGKERIRRAGAKIKEETGAAIDYGFRVLKCADSNMKPVYYAPSNTKQEQLDVLADNIKEDRTGEDLLFQVMLELGVPLSSTIEYAEIAGQKVYDVGQDYLLACFDLNVTEASIIEIAKREPTYFVMRDRSMANDTVAANFEQIFRTYSPDTVRKVL